MAVEKNGRADGPRRPFGKGWPRPIGVPIGPDDLEQIGTSRNRRVLRKADDASPTSNPLGGCLLIALVPVSFIGKVAIDLTRTTLPLDTNHSEILAAALILPLLFWAALFWRFLKRPDRPVAARLKLGFQVGFIPVFFVGYFLLYAAPPVAEAIDFAAPGVKRSELLFRIDPGFEYDPTAASGSVQLDGWNRHLRISEADRKWLLANRKPLPKHGFCVQLPVEQIGDAIRIMRDPERDLPSGSLGACPE